MPEPKTLTGRWVHPADGDNYPTELTMTVVERGPGLAIISWKTITTGHPAPFRDTEHTFTFAEGSGHILMATKRPDGSWAPPHAMDGERWGVPDGTCDGARERIREFFTELGYEWKGTK